MRAFGAKLILILGSLALTFCTIEAGFRLFDYRGFHADRVRDWRDAMLPASDERRVSKIKIQFKPNSQFRLIYDSNPGGYFDADNSLTIRLNNHGHRGPDFELHKPPGLFRVLVLGDSFTLGEGVRLEHTFVHRLGTLLGERVSSKLEVLNLGVSGWSTTSETHYLEQRALAFEPDLVVLIFVPNDANYAVNLDLFEDYRARYEAPKWLQHSYLASFVYTTINREIAGRRWMENKAMAVKFYPSAKYKWKFALKELVRANRLSQESGAEFAVVMFPFMFRLSDDYPLWRLHALVENTASENQIPYLDLLDSFKGNDYVDLWVHPSDQHPNPRAHQIAARAIADFLIEQGLLPPH